MRAILNDCGWFVRKSFIHRQMLSCTPRLEILKKILLGKMVLNTELSSTNSSRAYAPCCSRWRSTVWRAVEFASSVDLLVLYV